MSLVSGSDDDHRYRPRQVRGGYEMYEVVAHLAWCPRGDRLAFGCLDGGVGVLADDPMGPSVRWWSRLDAAVTALAWSPQGALAVGDLAGGLRLWGPRHCRAATVTLDLGGPVSALAWSPRGDLLAVGAGAELMVVSAGLESVTRHPSPAGAVNDLVWADGPGDLVMATKGGVGWVSAGEESSRPARYYEADGTVLTMALDTQGDRLAFGDTSGILHLTHLVSGEEVSLSGYPDRIEHVEWDRSGLVVVVPAGDEATLWFLPPDGVDPVNDEPVCLRGHDEMLTAAVFSPAGAELLTADTTGRICLWGDVDNGPRLVFDVGAGVRSLQWHPSGTAFASGTAEGRLRIVRSLPLLGQLGDVTASRPSR